MQRLLLRIGLIAAGCLLLQSALQIAYESQIWRFGGNVLLLVLLVLLSFGIIAAGALNRLSLRWQWLILLVVFVQYGVTTAIWLQNTDTTVNGYSSRRSSVENIDTGIYNELAAGVALAGHDPYSWDFSGAFWLMRSTVVSSTPQMYGGISGQYAYPPLTFLLPMPFRALGLPGNFIVASLAYLLLATTLFLIAPGWLRSIVLLPLMVSGNYIWLTIAGNVDVVWAAMLVLMVALWRKPLWRALLFGLVISYKQNVWLLAPFLLIKLWQERQNPREALREILVFSGISGATFVLINLPYFLMDPGAWFRGILQPVLDSMLYISDGGLSSLTLSGLLNLPKTYYSLASLLVLGLLLLLYWRHPRRLSLLMWIMPGLAMWFSYRNLQSYWIFWLFPAVAALMTEPVPLSIPPAGRPALRRSGLLVAGTALVLVLGAWVSVQTPQLELKAQYPLYTSDVGTIAHMNLALSNHSDQAMEPRFFVQRSWGNSMPWYIDSGPRVLQPQETASYQISAQSTDRTPNIFEPYVITVHDAGGDYALTASLNLAPDRAVLWPDLINNASYLYWTQNQQAPVYWSFLNNSNGASYVTMTEINERPALTLMLNTSRARSNRVEVVNQMIFPDKPFGIWVYVDTLNNPDQGWLEGIEFNDAQQRLLMVFDPNNPDSTQLTASGYILTRHVPANAWTYVEINLPQIYADLDLPLPELRRTVFFNQVDTNLRVLNLRLFAVTQLENASLHAYFGEIVQPDDTNRPIALMADAINDPATYYRDLGNFHISYRNYENAAEAFLRVLDYAPGDAEALSRLRQICPFVSTLDRSFCD